MLWEHLPAARVPTAFQRRVFQQQQQHLYFIH